MGDSSQLLATHLINQIRASLSVLEQLDIIQAPDADAIRTRLPPPNGPFPSINQADTAPHTTPVPMLPQRIQPPQESRGRALWDYTGNEPDDLRFKNGDIIIIDEEVNDQWYRGRVIPQGELQAREHRGLFPSNYVEKIQSTMVPYQAPYPNPPQLYQHQQVALQQQQLAVKPEKSGKLGRIGAHMGYSAIGGVGFGAGSAVASDLVNRIF